MADHLAKGQGLALIGLVVNFGLSVVKLLAGLVGHSYALVADAIESMTDLVGSIVIWGGLRIAGKPADEDHPYGHGKAEALAGLIVAMMVLAAGVGIAVKSIAELLTPHHSPAAFTLWVLIGVIVIKVWLFVVVRRAGRESGSSAVHVDAWHHISDAITSLAALAGISASLLWGYGRADDIAAIVAAAVISANAVLLCRDPIHDLMDKEPADVVARVREIARAVPGVVRTEKMAARASAGRIRVDMHLEVPPTMTVLEAHAVSHRVKDAVMAQMSRVADVLIHIEPAQDRLSGTSPSAAETPR
jgi:cation diffusion facilitator family transporter